MVDSALTVLQIGNQKVADFKNSSGISIFCVDSSNVGIGTNPEEKLHVHGTIKGVTLKGDLSNSLLAGAYLTGSSYNNEAETTFAVDATSANTASKVVARDASGNFSAGTVTFDNITVANVTNAFVPRGLISMWSGSIATIPSGWAICNGANGTPDLRNRFIIGAGSTYAVGASGGSSTVTLTVANLPAHTHTGTTDSSGSHNHGGSTGTGGSFQTGYGAWTSSQPDTLDINRNPSLSYTLAHNHSISTDGAHTHTFSTSTTTGATATSFSILPPYYALAFVMKL